MPPKKKSPVDATPVDVNAPRKTRNQKKAEEANPPAPCPKPHRHAPGKQPALTDEHSTPSRRSTRPAVEDIANEDDLPSRQATPTPDNSESSSDEEDIHLPLPPGIDSFSDLGQNSKTKPVVKPGPIPAAAQEAAFLLHAQYQRNIKELAAKHGKSPEAFYALLGSGSHLTRGRDFNSWAAWQAWYSVHGASKPDHVSVADWTRHVSKEYVQHIFEGLNGRPDTPANRRKVLNPTVQWYREHFANQVAHYRSKGKMKQVLDKVINECLRVSTMAYELYNVHVCGFAVNLDPDNTNCTHSAPFGASPDYEEMLKKNKPVITRELNLWESHLRIAHASASNEETINTTPFFVGTGKVVGEPSKDHHCRLFSAFLRADLGMSQHISMSNRILHKGTLALSRKLCLINWPASAAVPHASFTMKNDVPPEAIRLSNKARKEASSTQDFPIRATCDEIDCTLIVAWPEESTELDPDSVDFKTIPLVIDTQGKVLLTVEDAMKDAEKMKKPRKPRRKYNADFNLIEDGSDGEPPATTPPPRPSKGKKRAAVTDEPQGSRKGKKAKLYKLSAAQMEAIAALTGNRLDSESDDDDDDED
ncbi:hypothetical protein H0H92_016034 [Tricholoma furcatifolium]|nr:hypothetical protein H0H92_016034 [Tricholoma furcatifolium]